MKEIYSKTNNFSKKYEFNIKAGARSLREAIDKDITVIAACTGSDVDSNGEKVNAAAIIAEDGTAFTTISKTAIDLIESLIDMMIEDNQSYVIHVSSKKSKSDRDYIVISLV